MISHKSDKPPFRLFRPWDHVPEIEHLPNRTRFEIWERANAASRIGCLATAVCFVWVFFLLDGFVVDEWTLLQDSIFEELFYELRLLVLVASLLIMPLMIYALHLRVGRKAVRRWMVQANHKRLAVCIECGYSLVGTPDNSTQCPECGSSIPEIEHHPIQPQD